MFDRVIQKIKSGRFWNTVYITGDATNVSALRSHGCNVRWPQFEFFPATISSQSQMRHVSCRYRINHGTDRH